MKQVVFILCFLLFGCNSTPIKKYHIKIVNQLGITIYDKKIETYEIPRVCNNITPGIITVQSNGTLFSEPIVTTSNLNTVTIEREF